MKMKFAAINRDTNQVMDLFDSEHEAYNAMMEYIAQDRLNHTANLQGYYVSMMILDSNNNLVIRGRYR